VQWCGSRGRATIAVQTNDALSSVTGREGLFGRRGFHEAQRTASAVHPDAAFEKVAIWLCLNGHVRVQLIALWEAVAHKGPQYCQPWLQWVGDAVQGAYVQ
jgi:hypothetical protein